MKNVQRPFHAPKNLSQNYPQQRSLSLSHSLTFAKHFPLTGFCFERLSDGWFWFIAANYLTSFLSSSAEKNPVLLTSMLLTDCHLMLVFLSLPVPLQCFYVTKDTLFSRFLTADCLSVCTIFHLLWLNVDRAKRK